MRQVIRKRLGENGDCHCALHRISGRSDARRNAVCYRTKFRAVYGGVTHYKFALSFLLQFVLFS